MSDDHDWVARLLAASGPAAMPDDVSDRLVRALRAEAGAPAATPSEAVAPADHGLPAPPAAPPHVTPELTADVTPDVTADVTPDATADVAADVAPDVAADLGPEVRPDLPTATPGPPATPEAPEAPAAPQGVVPPPATAQTTGALPRLRSVSTGEDRSLPGAASGTDGAATTPEPGASDTPLSSASRTSHESSAPESSPPVSPASPASGRTVVTPLRSTGSSRRELREEDQGERRRRGLVRWAPVAAGVLVLGGAAVVVGNQLGGADSATLAEDAGSAAAGAASEVAAAPRSLVATGTEYSTLDRAVFDQQVRDLVALAAADPTAAGGEEAVAEAAPSAEAGSTAPTPSVPAPSADSPSGADEAADTSALSADARSAAESSPLADPQALADCVEQVTAGTSATAAAVDLAVVDGLESTLLVVPDAAGLTYQVYVVGAGCGDLDTRFDFLTVTP